MASVAWLWGSLSSVLKLKLMLRGEEWHGRCVPAAGASSGAHQSPSTLHWCWNHHPAISFRPGVSVSSLFINPVSCCDPFHMNPKKEGVVNKLILFLR